MAGRDNILHLMIEENIGQPHHSQKAEEEIAPEEIGLEIAEGTEEVIEEAIALKDPLIAETDFQDQNQDPLTQKKSCRKEIPTKR